MKLVVGLGNPERKYHKTRHNVGFAVLGRLAQRLGAGPAKSKFHGEFLQTQLGGEKLLLLSPLTYMNRSGLCVQEACSFYRLPLENLLVVCDDFNLPLPKLRFRAKGSAGGQKGLADIIRRLGSEEFGRLRIGIGAPPEGWDPANFVLSKFSREETPIIEETIERAVDAVVAWVREGMAESMNQYNC